MTDLTTEEQERQKLLEKNEREQQEATPEKKGIFAIIISVVKFIFGGFKKDEPSFDDENTSLTPQQLQQKEEAFKLEDQKQTIATLPNLKNVGAAADAWKIYMETHKGQQVVHINPVKDGTTEITSGFGTRNHPTLHVVKEHTGLDMAPRPPGNTHIKIGASAEGVVLSAGWRGGYGNAVMIGHVDGTTTLYGHMQSLDVKAGDNVSQGQDVGTMGSTGRSTGIHLHYEQRNTSSAAVAPKIHGQEYSKGKLIITDALFTDATASMKNAHKDHDHETDSSLKPSKKSGLQVG